ncbi:MAG TPA: glycosyltransferase family 1 protein [Terriglobales bacterium]|nr:glycosyltransferase family 1 protein [Terriglobales bacterium]
MRIGFDARWYNRSGVGTYVRELLGAFAQRHGDFELVVLESADNPVPLPNSASISRVPVDAGRFSVKEQFEIPALCKSRRLDLLHVPYQYGMPLVLPCPLVITVHDLIPFLFRTRKWPLQLTLAQMVKLGYRAAVFRAHHVIADSLTTARDLQTILGVSPERITAVHLGTDDAIFHPNSSNSEFQHLTREYGVRFPYVVVGSAINWRTKNLQTSLQALALAKQISGINFQTVVYGIDDGITVLTERNSTFGLDICRAGYLPSADLGALFRHAQLFITSSLYEGFGLPALEAMSCGCPVVSSNRGSLPEVVADAAPTFNPLDARGMAQAVATLLSNPDERELWRARALSRASNFSWVKAAEETAAVYRKVCDSVRDVKPILSFSRRTKSPAAEGS